MQHAQTVPLTSSPPPRISAMHAILDWSASRPTWQRDALRRIISKVTIDANDLDELAHLCRVKHGAAPINESVPSAVPLAAIHIPPLSGMAGSVNLVSIGNLKSVNRLPPNQVITFGAAPGLTVIYGDNGSGKSGYARVIKKACRTRGALPQILPDAFDTKVGVPSEGSLTFNVGSTNHPTIWKDGIACDSRLSNIFVFDSNTAHTYLEQDGPASFTPHGLDVLPKLIKISDEIGQRLKDDITTIRTLNNSAATNWKYSQQTAVGRLIKGLSEKTSLIAVNTLSELTAEEKRRLQELSDALKSDPKQRAKETRASKSRLDALSKRARETEKNLSDIALAEFRRMIEDSKTTAATASAFALGQFDATELPGTRSELWRKLWEAARLFSTTEAYEDREFPVTEEGARCVLCQQDLEQLAGERLKRFETFCKDVSQKLAGEAASALKKSSDAVVLMSTLSDEASKCEADLAIGTDAERQAIADFVSAADERLRSVRENFSKNEWSEPIALTPSAADIIDKLAGSLEARAKTEESADDPATRQALERERDELSDREWLKGAKSQVLEQIDRCKRIANLEASRKDVSSTGITLKNSELTKLLVTDEFCNRFKIETDALGLRTLDVKLQEIGGAKGEVKFGLRFEAQSKFSVREIASEGEQRCVALAAFLAELSQASHQSALVFDDPVSSLDHWHREKIAKRLVQECKSRQVIVFTHDACFLNDLYSHAENESAISKYFFLDWKDSQPGWCYDGLPWDCKTPQDRLDKLEKRQREISQAWGPKPSQSSIADMKEAYGWLRATIERIVERVAFADVVFRFRNYVNLKNLERVVGFCAAECSEINRLFKKCCEVTEAHDAAQGRQATIPEPKDLLADIEATKKLLADIRARQNAPKSP